MEVERYAANLVRIRNDFPEIIEGILKKNEGTILGMLKIRLYTSGTDGKGDLIGDGKYAPRTIARKKKLGQKTNIITLRDKGNLYASMFLEIDRTEYLVNTKISYADELIRSYGEAIFDLTTEQQNNVVNNIVDVELQKIIDSNIHDIDISF